MKEEVRPLTFGEFAGVWIRDWAEVRLKPTGLLEYQSLLRVHVLPAFGARVLAEISPHDVAEYLAHRVHGGLSPRTVENHLHLLRRMFRTAVEWRLLSGNPAAEVAPPRWVRPQRSFLTTSELGQLIDVTAPSWRLLVATACLTGCRKGEELALSWDAVSTADRTIRFSRSMRRGVIYDVKTPASRASVPMPASLVPLFDERRSKTPRKDGLVFCRADGSPLPDALPNRVLRVTLERAGLPQVRWHDLRRSWVIGLIEARAPVKTIVALGRWEAAQTFLNEYAEFLPSSGQEAIEDLSMRLGL